MKAIAVKPRNPNSVHMAELAKPKLSDVPNGRGVLVKVLKVGVDATDREINEGLYGNPPPGYDFLVMGHESFGIVEEVGPNVRHVKPGDYVTCTVRRPGGSIFDRIGHSDMTSEATYYERGINLLHGYMTEHYVDDAEFVVRRFAGHVRMADAIEDRAAWPAHGAGDVIARLNVPHIRADLFDDTE